MPRTFSLFSIRYNTTIVFVDSNVNMIQGDLRHVDRSTTITNRDAFNVENTVTEQQLLPTTSLGNDAPTPLPVVSPNPSAVHHEHDIDRTPSTSEMPSNVPGTRGSQPASVEMTASVHSTTSHFDANERGSHSSCISAHSIKKNKFTSVYKKVKRWIKRAL